MPPVQFEGDNSYMSRNFGIQPSTSKMIKFLIHIGIARDIQGAKKVLVLIATIFLIISAFLFYQTLGDSSQSKLPLAGLSAEQRAEIPLEELKILEKKPKW